MRILYFSKGYTIHDHNFLKALGESKHMIWHLRLEAAPTDREGNEPPPPKDVTPVTWTGEKGRGGPEAWVRLMPEFEEVLKRVGPDLVHAGPVQSCGFLTALAGFHPFLVMSWGSDILRDADRDAFWTWLTRYTLQRSDWLLCDCDAVRKRVQRLVPYEDRRIVQFPWGVDLRRFRPGQDESRWRERLGWEGNFIVLATRSWEPIYGIDVLIAGFALAFRQAPGMRLLLVGDGSMRVEVERLISEARLEGVVAWPGRLGREDLADCYRAADLYVSASFSDGTSVSLLEAMATGLPVVVTDVGGAAEWVKPGLNGWLVPPGDAAAIGEALLEAVRGGASRLRDMGRRNRESVVERGDWSRNIRKLLELYDEIEANHVE